MSPEVLETLIYSTIRGMTPLLFAGMGILILEKSGLLNLGQEGVMSIAAVVAFIAAATTGSFFVAMLSACAAATALVLIYAFLVFIGQANQVVTGLALSIFGVGLASYVGSPFLGQSIEALPKLSIPALANIPLLGAALFKHDLLVYLSWLLPVGVAYFLYKTRLGCILRSVGDNPHAAFAMGYRPNQLRLLSLVISAALVGLGGAYLTLSTAPVLAEGVSAGRGWIALALVVFSSHKVGRLVLGAFLFGLSSVLQLGTQAFGLSFDPSLVATLPYVTTIVALVVIALFRHAETSPRALAQNFEVKQ